MKSLSIKFIILGLVFYSSASLITQFLIAVPLSNVISGFTDKGDFPAGIFPPSIIISVILSKMLAAFAAAGYLVRHVNSLPIYHALVIGIFAAIIGSFINEITDEQVYLAWLMAFSSIFLIVFATACLKGMAYKK